MKKTVLLKALTVLSFCVSQNATAQTDSIHFDNYTNYPISGTQVDHIIGGNFFNSDGREDIIVPSNYDGSSNDFKFFEFKQSSIGTVLPPVVSPYLPDDTYGIKSITAGQMDENNLLDFGYTSGDSCHIRYQNNFGGLNQPIGYYMGTGARIVTFGDADNDHHTDIVVSLSGSSNLVVRYGDGHGNFLPSMYYAATSTFHDDIEVGKIGTNPKNVIAKIVNPNTIAVYMIHDTTRVLDTISMLSLPVGSDITSIAIGDKQLVADYNFNALHWISIWNSMNAMIPDTTFSIPGNAGAVQIGHLNCDPKSQIVELASGGVGAMVTIASRNVLYSFPVPSTSANPDAVALADVNSDGKLDILTCDYFTGMYILMNTSTCGTTVDITEDQLRTITVFPRLCTDVLYVENTKQNEEIAIYDASGTFVKKIISTGAVNVIDVSDLARGLFVVHVQNQCFKVLK